MHAARTLRLGVDPRSAMVIEKPPDPFGLAIQAPAVTPKLGLVGETSTCAAAEKAEDARI
jgi:hypothetical protein